MEIWCPRPLSTKKKTTAEKIPVARRKMFDCGWVMVGRRCSWLEPRAHASKITIWSEIEQNFRNQTLKYIVRCYQPESLTRVLLVEKRWLVLWLHTKLYRRTVSWIKSSLHLEIINLILKKSFLFCECYLTSFKWDPEKVSKPSAQFITDCLLT